MPTGSAATPPASVTAALLAIIRSHEAVANSYSSYVFSASPAPFGDLTRLTIREVLALQKANPRIRSGRGYTTRFVKGKSSTAAGAYGIVSSTLRNLVNQGYARMDEKFSVAVQDRLATVLLNGRRWPAAWAAAQGDPAKLEKWVRSTLALEWESFRVFPEAIRQAANLAAEAVRDVGPRLATLRDSTARFATASALRGMRAVGANPWVRRVAEVGNSAPVRAANTVILTAAEVLQPELFVADMAASVAGPVLRKRAVVSRPTSNIPRRRVSTAVPPPPRRGPAPPPRISAAVPTSPVRPNPAPLRNPDGNRRAEVRVSSIPPVISATQLSNGVVYETREGRVYFQPKGERYYLARGYASGASKFTK